MKVVEWETHRRELFNIIIKVYFRFDVDASAHDVVKVIITCRQTSLCVYLRSGRGHLIPVVFGVTIRTPLRAELLLLLLFLLFFYAIHRPRIKYISCVMSLRTRSERGRVKEKEEDDTLFPSRAQRPGQSDQLCQPSCFCLLQEKPKVLGKREYI